MFIEFQQVAIVTGASYGVDRAIALRLSADGFSVVVNYLNNEAEATEIVEAIMDNWGIAIAVRGDVGNCDDVAYLFKRAKEVFGRIDVVVNSADIMSMVKMTEEGLADFDKIIATNLRGTFPMFAAAAANLCEGGRIIAISTSGIGQAPSTYGPYIASKAGTEGLVGVLAKELRGRGITVNAVAPVTTECLMKGKTQQQIDNLTNLAPLERLSTPESIADVVAFLSGSDGRWVNAQILRVNGGFA